MAGLLVLDFDGTLTDAEAEGAPYRQGYLADLSLLTGFDLSAIEEMADAFEADVAANAGAHGWTFGGSIVAPATVDPYLRVMPVARRILDEVGCFANPTDRSRLLDGILYKYNYAKTDIVFKEGAAELVQALEGGPAYVVTNSHTEPVQHKIRTLGERCGQDFGWLVDRVTGSAKKYVLSPDWDGVAESMQLPGLERPVLLRRQRYFRTLDALRQLEGADWDQVVVVGDIFELDLCLPLALGATVGLMVNPFTPSWEKDFLAEHPRGHLLSGLDQVQALLG